MYEGMPAMNPDVSVLQMIMCGMMSAVGVPLPAEQPELLPSSGPSPEVLAANGIKVRDFVYEPLAEMAATQQVHWSQHNYPLRTQSPPSPSSSSSSGDSDVEFMTPPGSPNPAGLPFATPPTSPAPSAATVPSSASETGVTPFPILQPHQAPGSVLLSTPTFLDLDPTLISAASRKRRGSDEAGPDTKKPRIQVAAPVRRMLSQTPGAGPSDHRRAQRAQLKFRVPSPTPSEMEIAEYLAGPLDPESSLVFEPAADTAPQMAHGAQSQVLVAEANAARREEEEAREAGFQAEKETEKEAKKVTKPSLVSVASTECAGKGKIRATSVNVEEQKGVKRQPSTRARGTSQPARQSGPSQAKMTIDNEGKAPVKGTKASAPSRPQPSQPVTGKRGRSADDDDEIVELPNPKRARGESELLNTADQIPTMVAALPPPAAKTLTKRKRTAEDDEIQELHTPEPPLKKSRSVLAVVAKAPLAKALRGKAKVKPTASTEVIDVDDKEIEEIAPPSPPVRKTRSKTRADLLTRGRGCGLIRA